MVQCVAIPHIFTREVCKTHPEGDATVRGYWQGVSPEWRDGFTIDLDNIAVIDMNMKRVRVEVQAVDGPLFHGIKRHSLGGCQ